MKRTLIIATVLALLAAACGSGDVGDAGPVTLPPGDVNATTTTSAPTPTPTM